MSKFALVTGSTSGIGLALAKKLAVEKECSVFITGRNESKCKAVANEIQCLLPSITEVKVYYQAADLSSNENINELVAAVAKATDVIDYLFLNAGMIYNKEDYVVHKEVKGQTLDTLYQANCLSHIYLTLNLLQLLKNSKNPKIMFTSSSLTYAVSKSYVDEVILGSRKFNFSGIDALRMYGATKLALEIFAHELCREAGAVIGDENFKPQVVVYIPGMVSTSLKDGFSKRSDYSAEQKKLQNDRKRFTTEEAAITMIQTILTLNNVAYRFSVVGAYNPPSWLFKSASSDDGSIICLIRGASIWIAENFQKYRLPVNSSFAPWPLHPLLNDKDFSLRCWSRWLKLNTKQISR